MNIREPTYVICLERKNKERCDKHFPKIKNLFLKARRMEAVDASTLDLDDDNLSIYTKYHLQTGTDTDVLHLSMKGAVGCAMSHINVWKTIAASGEGSFVIEDDVNIEGMEKNISEAYKRLPDDVDFVSFMYLNWGSTKKGDHVQYNEYWRTITSRYFSGMQMYYLTPAGAQKLLKYAFPILTHIDVYVAYMASVKSNDFRGIFLERNIYPLWPHEFHDNLKSTLGHTLTVKKMLPDSNIFYYLFIVSYLSLVTFCIVKILKR